MLHLALLMLAAPVPTPEQAAFFETKVRPVLVAHCAKCHGAATKPEPKGGFSVESRAELLTGGDGGPGIVPGDAARGKLLEAIRYTNADLAMPPKGKLPANVIADLETWVKAGAPWPAEANAEAAAKPGAKPAFDLQARKDAHWAWKPVAPHAAPEVQAKAWPRDPADNFILAKLEAAKLAPAADAPKHVWQRRVTFALTGLPPTLAEQAAFIADTSPDAEAKLVDKLLASPAFAERWARHWLDLVRYAETRGHEFDPVIPNAFQYRDYVIRAVAADVPYDRFVREHLAGDLLASPRLDPETGANESVLGTGFWHLGEEVHSPVDLRQDQADRLDNRIDVMSKAFLGMTVSCARCHDHKFDAISAADYAAYFGILEGGSYRQVRFDGWAENRRVAKELAALRKRHAEGLMLAEFKAADDAALREWQKSAVTLFDAAQADPAEWLPDDVTFGPGVRPAGSVSLAADGTGFVELRAAAAYDPFWKGFKTHAQTQREPEGLKPRVIAGTTFRTRTAPIEKRYLHALVRDRGSVYAAVCGHTVIAGPLHADLIRTQTQAKYAGRGYRWATFDLAAYKGWPVHVECTAEADSDFAVALVAQSDAAPPKSPKVEETRVELPAEQRDAWQAEFAALSKRVVATSRVAPALADGPAYDDVLFIRGSPKARGEVVPRRNLSALGGSPLTPQGSGRAELAAQLTDPARNPLLARVAVNRVWHHLFGRGLVGPVDNFGVLGELPTHPELLDALAADFARDGFSTKRLIRRLALSHSYRMASDPAAEPPAADAANLLLHRFRVHRLEGEAIRDAMLSVSGELKPAVGGPPVPIHLTPFLDGRGRPASGPLDGDGRRSLYLAVRRNFLSPFLQAFDTPIPFSTVGRRQVSNVPAQALILMNDPFVHDQAAKWARRELAKPGTAEERVQRMVQAAYGRAATAEEVEAAVSFVGDDAANWKDYAHALFLAQEFVYVR